MVVAVRARTDGEGGDGTIPRWDGGHHCRHYRRTRPVPASNAAVVAASDSVDGGDIED